MMMAMRMERMMGDQADMKMDMQLVLLKVKLLDMLLEKLMELLKLKKNVHILTLLAHPAISLLESFKSKACLKL